MILPPLWKLRRELRRIQLRLKVALVRFFRSNSSITYQGLTIPLGREGMSAEILMGIESDNYELPEITGLHRVLRDGDRVLELGAGLGVVTAVTARAVAPNGTVLAFEANPQLIPATRDFLVQHNVSNVEVRHAVLVPNAEQSATREFHVARVFAVSSLMDSKKFGRWKTISVPTEGIGQVIERFRPNVLVCDIEGGEAELIPALDASGLRAVVIEMHPKRLSESEIAGLRAILEGQGLVQEKESPGGTVEIFSRPDIP